MVEMIFRMIKREMLKLLGKKPQRKLIEELSPIPDSVLTFLKSIYSRNEFFILGYGRSGTTLLARLINQHPDIYCNWQGHFFTSNRGFYDNFASTSLRKWIELPSNRWIQDASFQTGVMRSSIDFILEEKAASKGASIVGDKSPNQCGYETIYRMYCVFPDAFILYMLRDGRDVLISKRIQWFVDKKALLTTEDKKIAAEMTKSNLEFRSGMRSIFTPIWLEKTAVEWTESVKTSIRYGQEYFGDQFKVIRYEQLIRNPVLEMNQVMSWLGAPKNIDNLDELITQEIEKNPAADWHEHAAPSLVEGMKRGASGTWRSIFTASDYELFMSIAGGLLKDLGYSL